MLLSSKSYREMLEQEINQHDLVGGQFEKTQHFYLSEFIIIHMSVRNDIFIRIFIAVMLIVVKGQK